MRPIRRVAHAERFVGCRRVARFSVRTLMRGMGYKPSIAVHAPPRRSLATSSTPICCGALRSRGRTRSGRWTSPISLNRARSKKFMSRRSRRLKKMPPAPRWPAPTGSGLAQAHCGIPPWQANALRRGSRPGPQVRSGNPGLPRGRTGCSTMGWQDRGAALSTTAGPYQYLGVTACLAFVAEPDLCRLKLGLLLDRKCEPLNSAAGLEAR